MDDFSLWILWEFLLIKPFWKGPIPIHILPHTFFSCQLRFCKLWWESLIKAKGEIQRAVSVIQPWQGMVHCPISHHCWPAALQTAFTRVWTGGASTAVLQHPWESLSSPSLANSSFTTVPAGAALAWLLPSVWDGCWLRERSAGRCNAHGAVPATQNDSVPGPGKLQLVFVSDFFICLTGLLGRLVNTCI